MPEPTLKELTDRTLDKQYAKAAGAMLGQIVGLSRGPNSAMQSSLKKLDEEAARLVEAEEKMKPDNAQLEQTLGEYRGLTNTSQSLILANDSAIQQAGAIVAIPAVTAKVFQAITAQVIGEGRNPISERAIPIFAKLISASGLGWVFPDASDFAGGYVASSAWAGRLDQWGDGYADLTERTILGGIQQGWGPRRIASEMRNHAENIPVSAAENLTRTLQLTSYRDASAAMETVNGDFIIKTIRIATLDDRTCLNCISLHGTELAPGERPDDHFRGRCDKFYVVPGGPTQPDTMQADSTPGNRRFVPYQTGDEWFNSLPASRQAQQASFLQTPAKLRAFNDGVPLSAFRGDHTDEVFGAQTVEQSLVGALGDTAEQYYEVNQ